MLNNTAEGNMLNANPYQTAMVRQAFDAARPGIDSAFASSGRLGSGAYANAIADAGARAAERIGYGGYQQEPVCGEPPRALLTCQGPCLSQLSIASA